MVAAAIFMKRSPPEPMKTRILLLCPLPCSVMLSIVDVLSTEHGCSRTSPRPASVGMVSRRSMLMLAALGARTSAFHLPYGSVRRFASVPGATRAGRLLAAMESAAAVEVPASAADTSSEAISVQSPFLQTLVERGFYHQCTNVEGLDEKLCSGEVVKAYLGFDATADRSVQQSGCGHVYLL